MSKPLGGWGRQDLIPGNVTVIFWPKAMWEWYRASSDAVEAIGIAPVFLEAKVAALVAAAMRLALAVSAERMAKHTLEYHRSPQIQDELHVKITRALDAVEIALAPFKEASYD